MIHSEEKYVLTRKPHKCHECRKEIPAHTKCYWFKAVATQYKRDVIQRAREEMK